MITMTRSITVSSAKRLIEAEAIATRATRTTTILLAGAMALSSAAVVATFAASTTTGLRFDDTLSIRTAMHTSTVATMILAMVAAIVAVTGDFRFGRIDQLFLTAPRRSVVLAAKGVTSTIVGLLYGFGGALVSGFTAWIWFRANGESLDFGQKIVWQPLVGVVLAAPMFAAIGVGISAATRHQAGTIGGVLGWILLVEPLFAAGLPDVGKWFPLATALALTNSPDDDLLSPMSGGLVLGAYTVIALIIGLVQLRRTDV